MTGCEQVLDINSFCLKRNHCGQAGSLAPSKPACSLPAAKRCCKPPIALPHLGQAACCMGPTHSPIAYYLLDVATRAAVVAPSPDLTTHCSRGSVSPHPSRAHGARRAAGVGEKWRIASGSMSFLKGQGLGRSREGASRHQICQIRH